jgi:hypothetical protein
MTPTPFAPAPKQMPTGAPAVAQPVGYFPYADPAVGYYPQANSNALYTYPMFYDYPAYGR